MGMNCNNCYRGSTALREKSGWAVRRGKGSGTVLRGGLSESVTLPSVEDGAGEAGRGHSLQDLMDPTGELGFHSKCTW